MKLDVLSQSWGARYWFYCPGCRGGHSFDCRTDGGRLSWSFNGDLERPTFSPSLLIRGYLETKDAPDGKDIGVCHSHVRDGRIEFLGDCTHDLVGKTVDLPDVDAGVRPC